MFLNRRSFNFSILFCFLLVAGTIPASDETNATNSNANPTDLIPLTLGNMWTYKDIKYDTTGALVDASTYMVTSAKDSVLYGRLMHHAAGWYTNADSGVIQYFGYSTTGINGPLDTASYFGLFLKYPVVKGASYYSPLGGVSVPSIDTMINVPAGSFHCIRYNFHSMLALKYELFDYYVCPGVGIVKAIYYYGYNDLDAPTRIFIDQELQCYALK